MPLIVSQAEIAEIARDFGPSLDEDVAYLIRQNGTAAGSASIGHRTPGNTTIGPMGCRITYIGNMNVREREQAGALAAVGDYLASLPAGTVVYTSDVLMVSAKAWQAGKYVIAGQKRTPSNNPDLVFECSKTGTTGTTEPVWATVMPTNGSQYTDGTIVCTCIGQAQRYQIIQLASPATYSDMFATKMAVTLQQRVVPG